MCSGAILHACAAGEGKVVFGCADGKVYALDVADGKLAWSVQTGQAVRLENEARQRPAHDGGERHRGHESRRIARPIGRREPIGQIEHHAGKEPGFRNAQQVHARVVWSERKSPVIPVTVCS